MEPDEPFEPTSLVDLSVRRLRAEILGGILPPGERIVEEQLTTRYGISRAPLREALRQLAQQGLVEHLPRRGVRVAALSAADADELFGLRNVLERYAVELAYARPEPVPSAGLASALAEMAAAAESGDLYRQNDAHQRFHVEVVALAGQRHLRQAFEPVILKLQLHMATNLRLEAEQRNAAAGVERHRRLLEAVVTGDLGTAFEALFSHGARTYIG